MRWPVSIKGVVLQDDQVLLGRNSREEWELPGGRLEQGESPSACVEREIQEESGLVVRAVALLDAYVFEIVPGRQVMIVTFGCELATSERPLRASDEHQEVQFVALTDLGAITLPTGYRASIGAWTRARTA